MATITSAATGNWSSGATWVGGVKPGVNDRAVIASGHVVTLDEDATIQGISGAAATTNRLDITTSRTLTCTIDAIAAKSIVNGVDLIRISGIGTTVTINAPAIIAWGLGNTAAIRITSICTVNINANIVYGTGSNPAANGTPPVSIEAAATVTIVGDIYHGGLTGTATAATGLSITANAIVTITGNITASTFNSLQYAVVNTTSICTINVTGNCTGNTAVAIFSNQNSIINITGNLTASNQSAVTLTASPTTSVIGTITASNGFIGLYQAGGTVTFSGTAINASNGLMAIYCPTIKLYNAYTVEWRFRDELGNVKTLYSAGIALGNPAEANVRSGIVYGASNELTGSMIVPSPSDIRISVPTDNTVGTGQLTAADFLAAIAASADPVAVRLNNVSTVDTSGAQMASYNV